VSRSFSAHALIGYGTAQLMGQLGSRESARLVHAALDSGVTHFDTARVYGFGDTEMMLGAALRGRSDVSVFTKVGQGRARHSKCRSQIRASARPIARLRSHMSSRQESAPSSLAFVRRTNFSPPHVRVSVETSLKLLQREVIDGLLLHEVTVSDITAELLDLLDELKREGKVVRFGVASERKSLAQFNPSSLPGNVIQQSGGPFSKPVLGGRGTDVVLHSVFGRQGGDLRRFLSWIAAHPGQRAALDEILRTESLEDVPALLISYTSFRWPNARVLFASRSEAHIRENASAVRHMLSAGSAHAMTAILDAYNVDKSPSDSC
jgi:aryl-alcohol dehydrogenase-like predicted oxidoreductase